jgi:phage gpG-like protein
LASKFEKDLNAFSKKLGSFIELATDIGALDEYAEFAKGKIQQRTRAGRGVSYPNQLGGNAVKFAELSTAYKKARRGYILGEGGKPNKSSLTWSGEMIDSLKASVKKNGAGRNSILIEPQGQRNKDLTRYHAEGKGNLPKRVYLGLTRKDLTDINREFAKTFSEIIRKVFK